MKKYLIILTIITIILSLISCETETSNSTQQNIKNFAEEIKIIVPTVSFNTNGGSYIEPIKTNVINYEPTTTRQDHVFDGWYLDSSFITPASFPLEIKYDTMLYAKWLLIKGTLSSQNKAEIDSNIIEEKGCQINITPTIFEMHRLSQLDYKMQINISYDSYYVKDYDVLWDIGYIGAPEFETYVKKSGTTVISKTKQTATKKTYTYNLSYTTTVSDLINNDLTIEFWSDNIQNKLYFENIIVTYQCYK